MKIHQVKNKSNLNCILGFLIAVAFDNSQFLSMTVTWSWLPMML
jgi:hypothetical protein